MNSLQRTILAATALATLAAAPAASALPFSITGAGFAPGSGYGADPRENGGTLLNVQFSASSLAPLSFALNNVGDHFTFNFGSITLRETDAGNGSNAGIRGEETDHLDVVASLVFATPVATTANISASATATPGLVADAAVDYQLVWDPVTVDLGLGGTFQLSMAPLAFSSGGTRDQMATLTLLSLPVAPRIQSVPEPATYSLVALGLLGLAATRRRVRKA